MGRLEQQLLHKPGSVPEGGAVTGGAKPSPSMKPSLAEPTAPRASHTPRPLIPRPSDVVPEYRDEQPRREPHEQEGDAASLGGHPASAGSGVPRSSESSAWIPIAKPREEEDA
jgi:hypothetical protein